MTFRNVALVTWCSILDPAHYDGWDGYLPGVPPDGRNNLELAQHLGYETVSLSDLECTWQRFQDVLRTAVGNLPSESTFLWFHSGHGGFVDDAPADPARPDDEALGDEDDGADETLLLADGQVSDDQLRALVVDAVPEGVTLFQHIDSCYSGTITRKRVTPEPAQVGTEEVRSRLAPLHILRAIPNPPEISFTGRGPKTISHSACSDEQTAGDTKQGGTFTVAVHKVLKRSPNISWRKLRRACEKAMPRDQTPSLVDIGGSRMLARPAYQPVFPENAGG